MKPSLALFRSARGEAARRYRVKLGEKVKGKEERERKERKEEEKEGKEFSIYKTSQLISIYKFRNFNLQNLEFQFTNSVDFNLHFVN